jgi:hypothetical protein
MTSEEFVAALKRAVRDPSINACIQTLEKPPGRRPHRRDVGDSAWYNSLSADQKAHVASVVASAVDSALFGFLCILDSVSFLEDTPEKGDFELRFKKGSYPPVLINDPNGEFLHDIYNSDLLTRLS